MVILRTKVIPLTSYSIFLPLLLLTSSHTSFTASIDNIYPICCYVTIAFSNDTTRVYGNFIIIGALSIGRVYRVYTSFVVVVLVQ